MSIHWKQLTRDLCELHEKFGAAALTLSGDNPTAEGLEYEQVTEDADLHRVDGAIFKPKALRSWLWEIRKESALAAKRTVVWTAYDESHDASFAGIAQVVSSDEMRRDPVTT